MVKKSLAEGYLSKNTTDNGVFEDDNNEEDEAFTFAKVNFIPWSRSKSQTCRM